MTRPMPLRPPAPLSDTPDAADAAGAGGARAVSIGAGSPGSAPLARGRRRWVAAAAAAAGATLLGAPAIAQSRPKLQIGYWPIAGGLAFFAAIERGFFRDAGLDVEPVRFAGPNQVVEALLAGRIDGSANGTASTALALGDAQAPGLLKFFAT